MYLKEIQSRPPEGMMKIAFAKMDEAGHAVPEIMHLFRFKKRSTNHLIKFTEEVMRGPSPLPHATRELIGAFVSKKNQCSFCSRAHVAAAAQLMEKDLVDDVLEDVERSRLDAPHKALFRFLTKLAETPSRITASDINRLKEAGWTEEAIYDALTVASLFKFYNTWNNGSGVQNMNAADYAHSGKRLVTMGYCMDFTWKGILKIMWVGRKEITLADVIGLMKVAASKFTGMVTAALFGSATNGSDPASAARQSAPTPSAGLSSRQLERAS